MKFLYLTREQIDKMDDSYFYNHGTVRWLYMYKNKSKKKSNFLIEDSVTNLRILLISD